MRRKLIVIIIITLLIVTISHSSTGHITISSNINKNHNKYFTEIFPLNNSEYLLNDGIDEYIINEMEENHIPGLSATILKNDSVFWTNSYGYANISSGQLVKDTTLFRLASISKTIVATAIMQLYEQEYFDIHDPINDYLSFIVEHPNHPSTDITFHMLMTHTSSIKDNWDAMPYIYGDPTTPLGEYLENYLTPGGEYYNATLNFYPNEPGTYYGYTNLGAALVGYLVEEMTGIPFDEYCENNIFEPLEMYETAWFLKDLNISNIAVPYYWDGVKHSPYPHYSLIHYPSGNLRTSVTQLRNLLFMMMNNGVYNSTQILQESTVDLILSQQLPSVPIQGILWYKLYLGGRTLWGHKGGNWGCKTRMFFDPETNIGVIVLMNLDYDGIDEILGKLFDFAENIPPYAPSIDGPNSGKPGRALTFTFNAIDPNSNDVRFHIDWGDDNSDTTVFVSSGNDKRVSHIWAVEDIYTITVYAEDEFGSIGPSSTFQVTIPRDKAIQISPFLNFLQSHPNMFQFLQKLI